MTPSELKHFLHLLGLRPGGLAKRLQRSQVEISQVLSGERPNAEIRNGIVEIVRSAVHEERLWGPEHKALSQLRFRRRRVRPPDPQLSQD